MNVLLEKFYQELKEHLKNCYSNDGTCYWKTSLLSCRCNCKFCENFKMKVEFMNVSELTQDKESVMYSELRYHSSNHMPLITGSPIRRSDQYKNCNDKCWTYRFDNSENVNKFAKICNEMVIEIKWQKN